MFKTPVSTIRDVAELTEASPNLIARLLGEMRGPGEFEKIVGRLNTHDDRITEIENKVSQLGKQPNESENNRQSFKKTDSLSEQIVEAKIQTYAWIDSVESDRKSSQENEIDKARFERNRRIAYYCILIFAIWMVYAALTTSCSPPNGIHIR